MVLPEDKATVHKNQVGKKTRTQWDKKPAGKTGGKGEQNQGGAPTTGGGQ